MFRRKNLEIKNKPENKRTGDNRLSAQTKRFLPPFEQSTTDQYQMSTSDAVIAGAMNTLVTRPRSNSQHSNRSDQVNPMAPSQENPLEGRSKPDLRSTGPSSIQNPETIIASLHIQGLRAKQSDTGIKSMDDTVSGTIIKDTTQYLILDKNDKNQFDTLECKIEKDVLNHIYDCEDKRMVRAHKGDIKRMENKHAMDQMEMFKQHKRQREDYARNNSIDYNELKRRYDNFSHNFTEKHKIDKKVLGEKHTKAKKEMYTLQAQVDDLIFQAQQEILRENKNYEEVGIKNLAREKLQYIRKDDDECLNKERIIEDKYLSIIDRRMAISHIKEDCDMLISHEREKYNASKDNLLKGYIDIIIRHIGENRQMLIGQRTEAYKMTCRHRQNERDLHDRKKSEMRYLEDKYIAKDDID